MVMHQCNMNAMAELHTGGGGGAGVLPSLNLHKILHLGEDYEPAKPNIRSLMQCNKL